jgi:hypothetical protein
MKIIVITFQSGVMIAKFKEDPELLDLLIEDHDSIEEVLEVPFEGRVTTPERAIRELIRKCGKAGARKHFDRALEGDE